ncbi:MAG TPA: DoxX family protein [Sediminibacterium sp.]|uniref:DoxX family protein n=1 Tax=Sediminibacterium sp. TaxID=1917865 RepID=UPI0008B37872|nr:DoxX family protein [Sediminibacterium sp.]OHC85858.1 MAG: DoxX family protein [Sphingobacteriia bacterium RIFOXYC2_FULL_35_18]OHC87393.1 MAG: DoxX family protein [Sphingobacteriia bacterium RIFOXYD2_FULL_35_12]HLD52481.1 DoxX family protein [Sediminibacterium sp.]
MKKELFISWILRILAAIILLQTLYFKFTGAAESIELFTKLGVEPVGRIGIGIIELITGIALLIPRTVFIGAFLGTGIMLGAILSHVFILGISSNGDGGLLFLLAIVVLICSVCLLFLHKTKGISILHQLLYSINKK